MRRLPPLAAVRVFEAAARHENFTSAAAELGMTQAAVSYQIKLLEERLGAPLFRREKRRVVLTDAGRRAAPQITRAFDAIDQAFGAIRADDEGVLTVSTSNTFANTWLAWRLGSFQMHHPEMAVRLSTSDALADFITDDVDVAIRAGLGGWEGVHQELLVPIDFTPMCSAGFHAAARSADARRSAPRAADQPARSLVAVLAARGRRRCPRRPAAPRRPARQPGA